jgi:quercetin dioxygenase-like cupin family protein
MTFLSRVKRRSALLVVGAACAAVGFAGGVLAAPDKQMVLLPFQDITFAPIDPARPGGTAYAVLRGDPGRGPSSMLLRFGKATGELHYHNSDYELVLLKGTMKHRTERETEAAARPLGPGSYWFQPGKQVHADSCLTDECLMFVSWAGKRDSVRAIPPKK